jgi:hypothetical protein
MSTMDAWGKVIRGDVKPSRVIRPDDPKELDRCWLEVARDYNIFSDDDRFLISVGGKYSEWLVVQIPNNAVPADIDLGGKVVYNVNNDVTGGGEGEFVTCPMDFSAVCSVTVEEYEIWVIGMKM